MNEKEMRELDVWLAENVMGWRVVADHICQNDQLIYYSLVSWHPTTNIAQAFEVVEKMNDCLHLKEHGEEGEWCAMFCVSMMHYEHGETAALAICRAAKKARKGGVIK